MKIEEYNTYIEKIAEQNKLDIKFLEVLHKNPEKRVFKISIDDKPYILKVHEYSNRGELNNIRFLKSQGYGYLDVLYNGEVENISYAINNYFPYPTLDKFCYQKLDVDKKLEIARAIAEEQKKIMDIGDRIGIDKLIDEYGISKRIRFNKYSVLKLTHNDFHNAGNIIMKGDKLFDEEGKANILQVIDFELLGINTIEYDMVSLYALIFEFRDKYIELFLNIYEQLGIEFEKEVFMELLQIEKLEMLRHMKKSKK